MTGEQVLEQGQDERDQGRIYSLKRQKNTDGRFTKRPSVVLLLGFPCFHNNIVVADSISATISFVILTQPQYNLALGFLSASDFFIFTFVLL